MITDISKLEERIGYSFHNQDLIVKALTHTSYVNEHASKKVKIDSNQRLEFLGDSVLSTVISTYLYKHFTSMNEGNMSKLRASVVCETSLAEMARSICLQEYLLLGRGEELTGGRDKPSIQADAFESLLAAIYLDGGFGCVSKILIDRLDMGSCIRKHAQTYENTDYKTKLQESINTNVADILYEICGVEGPAHDCRYFAQVIVSQKSNNLTKTAKGSGRSKKDAEQQAAKALLIKLGLI